ncbi:hypothetical protein [Streptomyces sp. NPDC059916]|uniref:hypothetical protein n=1 Tax=Streptomyces sp. NPDC059916 TaxID=3347001 RepID=UPI00368538EF
MTTELPPQSNTPPMPGHAPRPAPSRRKAWIIAAIAAGALAIGGGAYWLSQPSYEEIGNNCVKALKARAHGDKKKPAACDGLKKDDYDGLVMAQIIDDLGWTDGDGNFDKNKMIEDAIQP